MYYKIAESRYVKPVKTQHGEFSAYEIKVEDQHGDGVSCQLLQKTDTPEPAVGSQIHGFIQNTDFGFRFKKTTPEDAGVPAKPAQASNGNGDTQNQIIRQSMVKAAVDLCIANQRGDILIEVSDVIKAAEQLVAYAQTGEVKKPDLAAEFDAAVSGLPFDKEPTNA